MADIVASALALSIQGPSNAVTAMPALAALGEVDAAFTVARGYYLGERPSVTPLHRTARDPSIIDQHEHVAQPLFIPACHSMREGPCFAALCEDIGLASFWRERGIFPDFLERAE